MSDSDPNTAANDPALWLARRDHELRARFEHLRALNSAWAALAPFGFSDEGRHIVETGRAVGAELAEIASRPFESRDRSGLPKLDGLLDAIESDMRTLAFEVPVAELRSRLPMQLASEHRGVLDLLDLMLVPELEGHEGLAGRISSIDYLITLLSTGGADGDGSVFRDPAGLTPRLATLCGRSAEEDDPRLAEIAAEFYAAAEASEDDARDEVQLRALRGRKRELGASFFAPRVLRSIVTYNAARSRCIERGVWDSRDWGSLPGVAEQPSSHASVFETQVLPQLAEALRQRAEGRAASSSSIDRVAWCLDLASLDEVEHAALLAPGVGRPEELAGTAILVGLLCRSAVVLEGEFPAIGISPESLSTAWVCELDEALKRGVQERIARNAYEEACLLSELRTGFLFSLANDVQRERRRSIRRAEPARTESVQQEARQIAGEALQRTGTQGVPVARRDRTDWRDWPWEQLARFAAVGAAAGLLALALAWIVLPSGDLDGFSRSELDRVSPYLERGARNEEGLGPAFVGTLGDAWSRLPADDQEQAATALVESLRAQGVREVMIYDDERRLRIQALGQQSVRVLPAPEPQTESSP